MTDVADMLVDSRQVLTFILAEEEYAVDILRVQEIRGWSAVTRIPNAPDYMKGVLNLRGAIIPVIDLRLRFGFGARAYDQTTVIVVVWVNSGDRQRSIGLVVDAVAETYAISNDDMSPAPLMGAGVEPDFIEGLATLDEKMIILLNLDYLLNSGDLALDESGSE